MTPYIRHFLLRQRWLPLQVYWYWHKEGTRWNYFTINRYWCFLSYKRLGLVIGFSRPDPDSVVEQMCKEGWGLIPRKNNKQVSYHGREI